MGFLHWIADHGFELLQAVGIIGSLGFTAAAFRQDDRSRRISNLLTLTAEHRDIWTQVYRRPSLTRVLTPQVDLIRNPITNEEALFVTFLILHLAATYHAIREGLFETRQALDRDIQWFFSLPIPRRVWESSKGFQDEEFVRFVEQSRQASTGTDDSN